MALLKAKLLNVCSTSNELGLRLAAGQLSICKMALTTAACFKPVSYLGHEVFLGWGRRHRPNGEGSTNWFDELVPRTFPIFIGNRSSDSIKGNGNLKRNLYNLVVHAFFTAQ